MIDFDTKSGLFTSTQIGNVIFHGFGSKKSGDGTKIETLHNLFKTMQPTSVVIPQQTHSTHAKTIGKNTIRSGILKVLDTDALVTNISRVALTVVTADCVPIIYSDREHSIVGISHGGWKGTLQNISKNVIDSMCDLGAKKEHISVTIGPCIADCCYEIYGPRLNDFEKSFSADCIFKSGKRAYLNLVKANRENLLSAGIVPSNIEQILACTSCDDARFWSYHRDLRLHGEMINFMMLR
ncbi:MAG: polyphenol oxidase family protein [Candidatus Roizmanbacteria bacterium]|nr:polyphenol oxidase family protein [Candidatus Roizmanbacteria bacterium]